MGCDVFHEGIITSRVTVGGVGRERLGEDHLARLSSPFIVASGGIVIELEVVVSASKPDIATASGQRRRGDA